MENYHESFIEDANRQINFKNRTVLEVGCGNGEMLKAIAEQFTPK